MGNITSSDPNDPKNPFSPSAAQVKDFCMKGGFIPKSDKEVLGKACSDEGYVPKPDVGFKFPSGEAEIVINTPSGSDQPATIVYNTDKKLNVDLHQGGIKVLSKSMYYFVLVYVFVSFIAMIYMYANMIPTTMTNAPMLNTQ